MSGGPGRLWPAALVAVLAVTVLANVAVLRVASDPDAAAMEPDAYAKAIAWDSTVAARDRSSALAWGAVARLEPAGAGPGGARLLVTLTDRAGRPVDGARVRVEAIHNGLARRFAAPLAPAGARPGRGPGGGGESGGRYAAILPLPRAGLWELRIAAARGGEHFATSLRVELAPGTP